MKYGGYALWLLRRLQNEGRNLSTAKIRVIIIYTADVTRSQTQHTLDERDLMELIVLPLTYKGKENQRNVAQEAVLLAKEIEDEAMQEMALAGILSFSDKIIDKKLANEIRRCLSMTKVGAIIAKEMEESEAKGWREGRQEGRQEGQIASLHTVLLLKGEIPKKLEERIQKQTRTEVLEQWLKIAVEAPDVDTFEMRIED